MRQDVDRLIGLESEEYTTNDDDFMYSTWGEFGQIKIIKRFKPARHPRTDRSRRYLAHCSICAKDAELFGNANFVVIKGSLTKDRLPCGCSPRPQWKEWQHRIRIERKCKEKGYLFKGWSGEYKGTNTKLILECTHDGNVWETLTTNGLMGDKGCPKCSVYGFSIHKPSFVYVLLVSGKDTFFTGYGVTCNIKTRLQTYRTEFKKRDINLDILNYFPVTGEKALFIENELKSTFGRYPQDLTSFRTEATSPWIYQQVVDFVESHTGLPPLQKL